MTHPSSARFGVLLHPVPYDGAPQHATVIRSDDGGDTWHAMADGDAEYAEEIAGALQWCANVKAAEAAEEHARIMAEAWPG